MSVAKRGFFESTFFSNREIHGKSQFPIIIVQSWSSEKNIEKFQCLKILAAEYTPSLSKSLLDN